MPGDLDHTVAAQPKKIHWLGAIFWMVITALGILSGVQGLNSGWFLALGAGAYVVYLLRGGRFVLWIW